MFRRLSKYLSLGPQFFDEGKMCEKAANIIKYSGAAPICKCKSPDERTHV